MGITSCRRTPDRIDAERFFDRRPGRERSHDLSLGGGAWAADTGLGDPRCQPGVADEPSGSWEASDVADLARECEPEQLTDCRHTAGTPFRASSASASGSRSALRLRRSPHCVSSPNIRLAAEVRFRTRWVRRRIRSRFARSSTLGPRAREPDRGVRGPPTLAHRRCLPCTPTPRSLSPCARRRPGSPSRSESKPSPP